MSSPGNDVYRIRKQIIAQIINKKHHDSLQTKILHQDSALNLSDVPRRLKKFFLGRMSLFTTIDFRGSMTLETAVVLPLFLLFMLMMLSFFDIIYEVNTVQKDYADAAKTMALMKRDEKDFIELQTWKQMKTKVAVFPEQKLSGYIKISARKWSGADLLTGGTGQSEDMVYKTITGTVYHTDPDCSYLNPSVRAVSGAAIASFRNLSGEIYSNCELCQGSLTDTVYITDYGNCWHSTPGCSGLKRTVLLVSVEEAGCPPCAKCAAKGGISGGVIP